MPELVVAHYQEDLSWLRKRPDNLRVTVYDKCPDAPAGPDAIPLPNVGREAHTYLHHLVSRYDTLAEWTIFCQGKPFDHAYDFKKTLRVFGGDVDNTGINPGASNSWPFVKQSVHLDKSLAPGFIPVSLTKAQGFHWLGHLIDTDDAQGHRLFRPWSKNDDGRGLDLRGFHRALFGTDGPDHYTFVLGAQFAVRREVVRWQPLSFYERALAVSVHFPDAAHCFERSWDRVFGLIGLDPDWLAGRLTVQLKPMRHRAN